jgi:hypothetical protein
MRRLFLIAAVVIACGVAFMQCGCWLTAPSVEAPSTSQGTTASEGESAGESASDVLLARAFEEQAHNLLVEGQGTVSRVLTDDTRGNRHQRFIVTLASGQTLLVTHNIDIAPRVSSLEVGDTVAFKGEYEWNDEGGVIHWTHHDPDGSHEAGWIKHNGRTYQ